MPENIFTLPDGTKIIVFTTDQHPDFLGQTVNINETLVADIPTYTAVADNVAPALNKNIITLFNNLPTKRVRVQEVYVYPRTQAANVITLQLGYISTRPTDGTAITINKFAADFPTPPASPNTVESKTNPTATPTAGILFGGQTFSLNTPDKYTIFESRRNSSALQLRPTLDGICLRQTTGAGRSGTLTAHVVFTLD